MRSATIAVAEGLPSTRSTRTGGYELRPCEACNGDGAVPRNVTLQEFAAMIEAIRTGTIAVKEEATR